MRHFVIFMRYCSVMLLLCVQWRLPNRGGRENREVIKKTSFAECWLQWLSAKRENGARSGCPLCQVLLTRHSAKKATRVAVDSILC
jgi:hypothetical protein